MSKVSTLTSIIKASEELELKYGFQYVVREAEILVMKSKIDILLDKYLAEKDEFQKELIKIELEYTQRTIDIYMSRYEYLLKTYVRYAEFTKEHKSKLALALYDLMPASEKLEFDDDEDDD